MNKRILFGLILAISVLSVSVVALYNGFLVTISGSVTGGQLDTYSCSVTNLVSGDDNYQSCILSVSNSELMVLSVEDFTISSDENCDWQPGVDVTVQCNRNDAAVVPCEGYGVPGGDIDFNVYLIADNMACPTDALNIVITASPSV